jgi:opacity protein-like surface antigen
VKLAAAAALALVLALSASAAVSKAPVIAGCPVFPAGNAWNQRVDTLPVAANSAQLIASIGLDSPVHADFGSGLYDGSLIGIPYTVVHGKKTAKSRVTFDYADESDKGPYPIPRNVPIEGDPHPDDGDRHALIVDRDSCKLYELFALHRVGSHWAAGSGAIWSLRSNKVRPAGWTSADAAGLPILPGLARWADAATGQIDHALRFTAERTRKAYVYPARHYASDSTDPSLPPMGLRVRLKASFDISKFPPQARIVLTALKRYGMILADNGSPWFISGAPSKHWSNDQLHTLGQVTGKDFEVVK